MAKGFGYESAVVAAEQRAAATRRNDLVVPCPLCGGEMEFDSMADSWFCYAAETSRGVPFCPGFHTSPDYDESRQGLILLAQTDARCITVRGRNGKTNIRVDGNPDPNEGWVAK